RVEEARAAFRARLRRALPAAHLAGERWLRFRLPRRNGADAGSRDPLACSLRRRSSDVRDFFPGFTTHRVRTTGTEIHCAVGGDGPPVLLLHGYPQTHAMWHRVAPALARHHTVVCADLRGYGDSGKPASDDAHAAYSKRAMAQDMIELMRDLGHPRFRLVGHDRGGRVAHRLCLDHPDAVTQLAVFDISPTRAMYAHTDQAFATAYYHWFFLIQPFDLPERLIGADPVYFLRRKLGGWGSDLAHFDANAL